MVMRSGLQPPTHNTRYQGTGGTGQGDTSGVTSKSQVYTVQQLAQNEILSSTEKMLAYRDEVIAFMNQTPHELLHLEVVSSATLQKGDNITIDPLGLSGRYKSLRAQNDEEQNSEIRLAPDSFTYFGSMPDLEYEDEFDSNQTTTMIVNDFVIPPRNRENAEQHRGRHF